MSTKTSALDIKYVEGFSYDEMFTSNMEVKPGWKGIAESLEQIGSEELSVRQKDIDWILSENGVTYNIYNDPHGLNRPWNLNIVPFVIQEEEWKTVEKGLKQRAHLLDLVVKDIYGKRELIKAGIIPSEVIYGHRGFLRQCDQIEYTTNKNISIYASDLSRGPDGRMWVVNDRAQAPSGMGYALENRITASRVLSDVYKNNNIKKITHFFNDLNQLLINASPIKKEAPTIVVLTPGPHSETYFEHAYLASYFGYPLVRGNDLVVRDGFLWMKSLKGLKQIDVILRRVDDVYMDPLELREDSYLGVAGLLNVVRKKNVGVVNPIGTGIVENSGLIPFMPAIAKFFLNEELLLPQIATWWCGQEKECKHVLENLSKYVIKRIDRSSREKIVFGEFLNSKEKEDLKNRIEKNPYLYVAQEKIAFSTVPNFNKGVLEPRNMVCRTFAIAKEDNYEVMPGGLIRVSPSVNELRVSNQKGGTSKDCCVLTKEVEARQTWQPSKNNYNISASKLEDLPSLTAENLYWLGRYLGRTIATTRYIRTVLKQLKSAGIKSDNLPNDYVSVLLKATSDLTNTLPGFIGDGEHEPAKEIKKELFSIILDKDKSGSLAHTLSMFSGAYYAVRNLWSTDMWRVFDSIENIRSEMKIKYENHDISIKNIIKILDQLVTRLIAILGLIEESILVDQGLLLYFIGLNLEVSIFNIKKVNLLLGTHTNPIDEYELLESLLNSQESLNIYRYTYRSHINIENTLSLLVLSPKYNRSLGFILERLKKDISRLPDTDNGQLQVVLSHITRACSMLENVQTNDLSKFNANNNIRENLKLFLNELDILLTNTSLEITNTYFNHVTKQSQLSSQNFTK
mgnify:CR=1 FL=1